MSSRMHDRTHFYKYTCASTALLVIGTQSFRWSAPTLFNDPFDHQVGFVVDTDTETFARFLTSSIERLIFGEMPICPPSPSLLALPILALRSIRDRLSRDDVVREIQETALSTSRRLPEHLAGLNAALHHELCHSRVFCVNETPANVVMWSHYGDQHRGVVFMLRCDDDLDNQLLAAQPVDYSDQFITFPSAEAYARHLTGEELIDLRPLFWKMAYRKHTDWSYEREWRVRRPLLNEPAGDGKTNFREHPSIFGEIYLGCRITDSDADRIVRLSRQHLPNTRIFQASLSKSAFTINFEEVS